MLDRSSGKLSADATRDTDVSRAAGSPPGKIGVVGLGLMGTAMAANLAGSEFRVHAFVRRPEQMKELQLLGVLPTMDMPDLFDCDVVLSMLPDDLAVRSVFFGTSNGIDGLD